MPNTIITKRCYKCTEIKLVSEFYRNRAQPDGRATMCIACSAIVSRSPEAKATQKKYLSSSKGKATRRAYEESPKGRLIRQRISYKANRTPAAKARHNQYRKAHLRQVCVYQKINRAIRDGILPPLTTTQCICCGGQAEHYHHHLGYEPCHALDVIPVCAKCHKCLHMDKLPNV